MHSHIYKSTHKVHSYTQKYKLIYDTHSHRQLHTHTLICLPKHTLTHKYHTLTHTPELPHAHKMDRDTPYTEHTQTQLIQTTHKHTPIHMFVHTVIHTHSGK